VIVGIEVSLAATVWWRRAWPLAATLGIGLHLAIILTGLELGLFPWLMLALYILILPDGVVLALLGWTRGGWRRVIADKLAGSGRWFVLVAAVVLGDALAAASQLEHALAVASTLVIVPITVVVGRAAGGRLPRVAWVGFAHLLALGTWVAVARAGHVAVDYHRRWGDDARRLGDAASAERAYGKLIELDPEEPAGHYQLGRLLLARGEAARGLAELREAQRLEPARARAYVEEARYLAGHGEAAAALAKAREATWAEDTSVEARALRDALTAGAAAPKPTGGGDAEADAP
jgi:tetratricopeptide (TPR) repeat protein